MQIFANGKQRFDSFMEFYVIHLKYQGVKIWSKYHLKILMCSYERPGWPGMKIFPYEHSSPVTETKLHSHNITAKMA